MLILIYKRSGYEKYGVHFLINIARSRIETQIFTTFIISLNLGIKLTISSTIHDCIFQKMIVVITFFKVVQARKVDGLMAVPNSFINSEVHLYEVSNDSLTECYFDSFM